MSTWMHDCDELEQVLVLTGEEYEQLAAKARQASDKIDTDTPRDDAKTA